MDKKIYTLIINIDNIQNFENLNLLIKVFPDYVYIKYKNYVPANIYFYILEGVYIYSLSEKSLADYLFNLNIHLNENENYLKYINTNGKKHDDNINSNHYKEIRIISLYKYVKLYKDHFIKETINVFSVNIHEAGFLIKEWIPKYKKIISDNYTNIIPELSAGLDTRALTYFWRNLPIKYIYTKDDPKEVPIVKILSQRISSAELCIGKKPSMLYTINGKGMPSNPGNIGTFHYWIYYICLFNIKHITQDIMPYLDLNIAVIKQDFRYQLKIAMQYLLAEDLMDIPNASYMRKPFIFDDTTKNIAKNVIKDWDI